MTTMYYYNGVLLTRLNIYLKQLAVGCKEPKIELGSVPLCTGEANSRCSSGKESDDYEVKIQLKQSVLQIYYRNELTAMK